MVDDFFFSPVNASEMTSGCTSQQWKYRTSIGAYVRVQGRTGGELKGSPPSPGKTPQKVPFGGAVAPRPPSRTSAPAQLPWDRFLYLAIYGGPLGVWWWPVRPRVSVPHHGTLRIGDDTTRWHSGLTATITTIRPVTFNTLGKPYVTVLLCVWMALLHEQGRLAASWTRTTILRRSSCRKRNIR